MAENNVTSPRPDVHEGWQVIMASGYTPCACRDCMDVTISDDTSQPDLCGECSEAGCTSHLDLPGFITAYGLGTECQREDAYSA
jgi:hypothetical protein